MSTSLDHASDECCELHPQRHPNQLLKAGFHYGCASQKSNYERVSIFAKIIRPKKQHYTNYRLYSSNFIRSAIWKNYSGGRPLIHTLSYQHILTAHLYMFHRHQEHPLILPKHVQPSIAPLATHEHLPLLAFHSTKC